MAKPVFMDLGSLTSVVAGSAFDVSHLEEVAAMIGGTFVGTCSIEASFDAGANWVAVPGVLDGATTPQALAIPFRCQQIRMNCTAFTSGTIEGKASGSDTDVKG